MIFGVRQVRKHRRSAHAKSTHQRSWRSCSASWMRPGRRRWIGGLLISGMKESPLPGQRGLFSVNRERTEGGCQLFTAMASRMFRASRTLNSVSIRGLPSSESAR